MNKLSDYQIGDVLNITFKVAGEDKTYKVEVENVNYNNNGLVTIWGNDLGATAFDPTQIGVKTRFRHIVKVEKVGHYSHDYRPPWSGLSHREAMRQYGVG